MNEGLRRYTKRQTTPRLQVVSPQHLGNELDLYGMINVTEKEARLGAKKLVSIPQGIKKRNVIVTIPAGVEDGTRLRLRGLGRTDKDGNQGDAYIEVQLKD